MPAIYSDSWLGEWSELINGADQIREKAPPGLWRIHVVIEGDGVSPHVEDGAALELMLHFEDGRCARLERVSGPLGPRDLDFRFTGPATVFEEIAAGQRDPIDAGLEGQIKIAGDMRFLLRYAELTTQIMDLYMNELETEWPHGMPPYNGEAGGSSA